MDLLFGMTPASNRRMKSFDPTKRCLVHNKINDLWIRWRPLSLEEYKRMATRSEVMLSGILLNVWREVPAKKRRARVPIEFKGRCEASRSGR